MPYSSEQKPFCSHSQSHLFTGAHPEILKKGEDEGRRRRVGGGGGAWLNVIYFILWKFIKEKL